MSKTYTNKKHLLALTVIGFVFCITSCSKPMHKNQQAFPIKVEIYKIQPKTYVKTLSAVGSLQSPYETEITSDIAGKITFLDINEGQIVEGNHILAKIDSSTYLADLKTKQATLTNAKVTLQRMQALEKEGAVSKQTLDDAIQKYNEAEAQVEYVDSVLEKTTIKAPFKGYLSLRKVSPGTYITPGTSLTKISQVNPIEIVFSVPEAQHKSIKKGQKVKFNIASSMHEYQGKVSTIDPVINQNTRTFQAKAIVNNPNRELTPGSFADIKIETETIQNAILIPNEAIIKDLNTTKVFKVSEENTASIQEIKIKEDDEDFALVLDGLMADDVIVTSGHQKLRPGAKIIPQKREDIQNENLRLGKVN